FGIPTLTYLPFVFFSLLSPVFSMVSAFTGLGIEKIDEKPNGTLGIDTNE
ncbi:Na+/H+ antiporter NhaC, partial [Enterococcus hirae]